MIRHLQYYVGTDTDPHQNLAREEYLTDTAPEDTCTLYLWQNRRTVVIGRNQNAWRECRTAELERDGGTLARRLSGGGAVYHDLGNLNFTFCVRTADYDLNRQHSVILAACRKIGIDAGFSGRNDILAGGRKFSGNSFYSHNGRSFHNGTLLVNVDMESLGKYLRPSPAKLQSKGVVSVRSRVVNLAELSPGLTTQRMAQAMVEAFSGVYGLPARELQAGDFDAAGLEARYARFHSYDWNYGKTLPFTFSCDGRFDWGEITLQLAVEQGACTGAAAFTDAMDPLFAGPLSHALQGCRFAAEALCERVRGAAECALVADDICALLRAQNI